VNLERPFPRGFLLPLIPEEMLSAQDWHTVLCRSSNQWRQSTKGEITHWLHAFFISIAGLNREGMVLPLCHQLSSTIKRQNTDFVKTKV